MGAKGTSVPLGAEGDHSSSPRKQRSVVSVGFSRHDLGQIADAARRAGMTTSEYIRQSALGRAAGEGRQATVIGVSGRGGLRGVGENITRGRRSVRAMEVEGSALRSETY